MICRLCYEEEALKDEQLCQNCKNANENIDNIIETIDELIKSID